MKNYNYADEIVKDAREPYQQNRKAGNFSLLKTIKKESDKKIPVDNVVKKFEKNDPHENTSI